MYSTLPSAVSTTLPFFVAFVMPRTVRKASIRPLHVRPTFDGMSDQLREPAVQCFGVVSRRHSLVGWNRQATDGRWCDTEGLLEQAVEVARVLESPASCDDSDLLASRVRHRE